jgi:hypothetical protein
VVDYIVNGDPFSENINSKCHLSGLEASWSAVSKRFNSPDANSEDISSEGSGCPGITSSGNERGVMERGILYSPMKKGLFLLV